ncbi:hypothetical protein C7212DRAFT_277908 [Tuber magnatum]|uniref:Zn(2)-C6 fungal-type domain-containing protein n=1 Tax=Tuber magnatum TaxID=42249 RepID=A0A317SVY2_9PEZI|nr:hypothetical protein C7212DRAFT_277908 [Tuber magnatum]
MYAASEPMFSYRIPPHQLPGFQPPTNFQQPAPRQRTAIACRYCRRRKIRCSGFESSPDGRCANCLRFNQECVFTPVSSQTQAFVPAHAMYPGRGAPAGRAGALYGAHGQPLPPNYNSVSLQAPVSSAQSSMEFRSSQQYPRPPSPGAGPNRQPPPPPAQPHYGSYEEPMAYESERNRSKERCYCWELHSTLGACIFFFFAHLWLIKPFCIHSFPVFLGALVVAASGFSIASFRSNTANTWGSIALVHCHQGT